METVADDVVYEITVLIMHNQTKELVIVSN
ncbi:hypothetical protein SDC9_38550 [bioreactor metagenome]|uniref:Uncharacterized protein n=1 Tax=bioreactor metagenome TaxID=1076179 RepID=A0A644VM27_9ZZZZ